MKGFERELIKKTETKSETKTKNRGIGSSMAYSCLFFFYTFLYFAIKTTVGPNQKSNVREISAHEIKLQ